jgi:hypothetical protein
MDRKNTRARVLIAGLTALLAVGMIAAPVLAGKGKPGGSGTTAGGTIALALMDGATDAHYGARVTFTVSTTATTYPYVHLRCSKGSTLVLETRQGFFPTAIGNQWFYLGPTPSWSSGGADCTATLEKSASRGGWSVLNSTAFAVLP